MAMRQAEVLQFPNNEEYQRRIESQKQVEKVYESFLGIHARNSANTVRDYSNRIEEFFQLVLKERFRGMDSLPLDDIQSIKKADVQLHFIDALLGKGNGNNTIQTKLNSVRSFYNELLTNELKVNPMIFKVKLEKDVQHHESLTFDELQELFEFMQDEKELGLEKYLLVKTLFTTANRKTATFGMNWKDSFIKQRDINSGEMINVIKVKDKGNKWLYKPISSEYYNELQQLNTGQEKVFTMNPKTMERALDRFSKKLGRSISMHSLKATAITLGYQMTRDINLCKQLGGHSSIVTTEIYLKEEKSLTSQLSYNISKGYDESVLDNLSDEDLRKFISEHDDIKRMIVWRLSQ